MPPKRPPLGLPEGSVRAVVTMIIVAIVIVQTLREQPMTVMLSETLMVALAHYFTSRRLLKIPASVRKQLEHEGVLTAEHQPLYLPRHTIRVLVVGTFLGLAGYMAWTGRLWRSAAAGTLGLVFAYFLGIAVSAVVGWQSRRSSSGSTISWWEDAKAWLVIGTTSAFALAVLLGYADSLPVWMANGCFGLILFYFGSR